MLSVPPFVKDGLESPGARPRLFMKHTWRTQRAHAAGTCASGARSRYHAVCSHTQTRRTLLGPAISTRRIRCRMANYSQIRSLLCMFFKCVGLVTSAIEVKSSGAGQSNSSFRIRAAGIEPRIQKGLRVRNSPTCTLSQNGYGDE